MCKAMDDLKDEGRLEGRLESIKNLMDSMHIAFDKACDILKVSNDDREILRARLN